jgi:rhodanese-related sulfurtransferase
MASIAPEVLRKQIDEGTAPPVIDVRSRHEFEAGHVPGARHIPFWQVAARWRELADARENEIVVYCGHGPRAFMAGAALKSLGFGKVVYLDGHMQQWRRMKLPLERA